MTSKGFFSHLLKHRHSEIGAGPSSAPSAQNPKSNIDAWECADASMEDCLYYNAKKGDGVPKLIASCYGDDIDVAYREYLADAMVTFLQRSGQLCHGQSWRPVLQEQVRYKVPRLSQMLAFADYCRQTGQGIQPAHILDLSGKRRAVSKDLLSPGKQAVAAKLLPSQPKTDTLYGHGRQKQIHMASDATASRHKQKLANVTKRIQAQLRNRGVELYEQCLRFASAGQNGAMAQSYLQSAAKLVCDKLFEADGIELEELASFSKNEFRNIITELFQEYGGSPRDAHMAASVLADAFAFPVGIRMCERVKQNVITKLSLRLETLKRLEDGYKCEALKLLLEYRSDADAKAVLRSLGLEVEHVPQTRNELRDLLKTQKQSLQKGLKQLQADDYLIRPDAGHQLYNHAEQEMLKQLGIACDADSQDPNFLNWSMQHYYNTQAVWSKAYELAGNAAASYLGAASLQLSAHGMWLLDNLLDASVNTVGKVADFIAQDHQVLAALEETLDNSLDYRYEDELCKTALYYAATVGVMASADGVAHVLSHKLAPFFSAKFDIDFIGQMQRAQAAVSAALRPLLDKGIDDFATTTQGPRQPRLANTDRFSANQQQKLAEAFTDMIRHETIAQKILHRYFKQYTKAEAVYQLSQFLLEAYAEKNRLSAKQLEQFWRRNSP